MTDLISGPDTGATAAAPPQASTAVLPPTDGGQPMEWSAPEPAPRRRRLGLWIGLGAGALVLAAAGASLILVAPGTTVAGVPIGGMTPAMAAEAISSRIATTEVELTGAGDGAVLTGTDLGAVVDASALAEQAFEDRPMWKLGSWMGEPIHADVALDHDAADRALRAAVPISYVEPVEAGIAFDDATAQYVTTPAADGRGISIDDLAAAFTSAADEGSARFTFSGDATEVDPQITDDKAATTAEQLNAMLAEIGFYIGDERTVPVEPAVAAGWLSVTPVDGEFEITADQSAIQSVVDQLAEQVNREVVNAVHIVDSQNEVLRILTEGKDGRVLGDTSQVASEVAERISEGTAAFPLAVTSTPFETTNLFRRIEVDLSEQRTYLYENEKLVNSWAISSGQSATPTDQGRFRVYAQLRTQDMRGFNADGSKYVTENVPYITYYNGDEGFHGTYWHSNFGTPMSHGCVNMTIDSAKFVWEWATKGTEVWVHG